ncbi:MAG: hypothetical protein AB1638_08895 [Nitrospirota bacterium]
MKRLISISVAIFLIFTGISIAQGENITIAALNETNLIVVKDIGFNSSGIELFRIVDGKIKLIDALFVFEEAVNQVVKFKRFEIKEK